MAKITPSFLQFIWDNLIKEEERIPYDQITIKEAQLFFENGIAVECDGDRREVVLRREE
ncbi:MAG TPA: hypothetical protein PLL80_01160 [Candidatus Pacearchaeota archaeon]|nr:hypothetical protein [Candidatus Pacearchaeota archaeon]HOK94154.1 hypothetical protein [Candidatus Pacearchaeota archaeon]HPO75206.1 hypothetical protein [Candidatus Pacearchaeota archaeon]